MDKMVIYKIVDIHNCFCMIIMGEMHSNYLSTDFKTECLKHDLFVSKVLSFLFIFSYSIYYVSI